MIKECLDFSVNCIHVSTIIFTCSHWNYLVDNFCHIESELNWSAESQHDLGLQGFNLIQSPLNTGLTPEFNPTSKQDHIATYPISSWKSPRADVQSPEQPAWRAAHRHPLAKIISSCLNWFPYCSFGPSCPWSPLVLPLCFRKNNLLLFFATPFYVVKPAIWSPLSVLFASPVCSCL